MTRPQNTSDPQSVSSSHDPAKAVKTGGHTPGPWYVPHFADDTCKCNCRSVVSESYAGAIATVAIDNGLRIENGGNDAPPLEEARANARLIAAAPDLLAALKHLVHWHDQLSPADIARAEAAIAKATTNSGDPA